MCAVRDTKWITCVVRRSRRYFSETFFQKREDAVHHEPVAASCASGAGASVGRAASTGASVQ